MQGVHGAPDIYAVGCSAFELHIRGGLACLPHKNLIIY